ncbi:hypothetical protein Cni_G09971 [Canna indica]|uniref:Response regulatory domain-containing protein n=1 Tax=Canna indica TaxID=4628 RepID=A0AAQ3K3F6_9LILI|nr:hypothetical protein Cni_G09971 [Canna indica]
MNLNKIHKMLEQKVDIILTNYCMPEMTGYDLLKAAKEQSSKKTNPVIIMSSENEPQRISMCRAIRAKDFILKPLRTNDVLRLRDYSQPTILPPKMGTKRKMALESIAAEKSGSKQRIRLAELAVA